MNKDKAREAALRIAYRVEKKHGTTVCYDALEIILEEIAALQAQPPAGDVGEAVSKLNIMAGVFRAVIDDLMREKQFDTAWLIKFLTAATERTEQVKAALTAPPQSKDETQ